MKTARIITSVLVMSVVLACSVFPVSADGTPGRKTITSSTYSYNDGDVTLYVRVNGGYSGVDGTSSSVSTKHANYQHTFDVVLVNNTNEFQVASSNSFIVKLYSGSSTVFAPSVSGEGSYHAGWGATVNSFSDNMSAPEVIFHRSDDYAGNVFIRFMDNDLLVLNPNETRTYSFTITFIQDIDVNYSYLNGNYMYSYFTYTGNVSFYNNPSSFTSQTIDDFINNDSLPDSVIAYLAASYQIETEFITELLDQGLSIDDIVSILNSSLTPNDFNVSGFYQQSYQSGSVCPMVVHAYSTGGYIISEYSDLHNVDTSHNYLVKVPLYYFFGFSNPFPEQRYEFTGTLGQFYLNIKPVINTGFNFAGFDLKIESDYFYIYDYLSNGNVYFRFKDNPYIVNPGVVTYGILEYDYYFYFDELTDVSSFISSINFGVTLNSYPVRVYSTEVEDDLDTIHDQEQQWYQQNEAAIESTGLANYSFTTSQISGLTAITTQFSQVWDALGDWNLVYIFTLLLSFATYILRHRPSTKSQQRVAASEEYRYSNFMHNLAWRNEIRARWKAQDARYDKGDSSGASDLMRRNVRR